MTCAIFYIHQTSGKCTGHQLLWQSLLDYLLLIQVLDKTDVNIKSWIFACLPALNMPPLCLFYSRNGKIISLFSNSISRTSAKVYSMLQICYSQNPKYFCYMCYMSTQEFYLITPFSRKVSYRKFTSRTSNIRCMLTSMHLPWTYNINKVHEKTCT